MCCVIRGLALPLFMISIFSDGIKVAAFGQKMDKIWMKAAAYEKMDKKLIFSAKIYLMQPYSGVKGI